jgi:hypothetical protein
MFLVYGGICITNCEFERVLWFFPVETPDSGVGAGSDAHSAANALVIILKDYARFFIFIGRPYRADPGTGGVLTMLTGKGNIVFLQIWECA